MSDADRDPDVAGIPEDVLPPVQPPSAGFILQLFVVPGLIVLAVVGVWALFGRMASSEQDWRSLVIELKHSNPHRRWRGAHGLAQMLKADQGRKSVQPLETNSEVARALSDLLVQEAKRTSPEDDELKFQAFLARTLGLFDVPEVVLPPLQEVMQPEYDREVRKNALGAIAIIANRRTEQERPLVAPALVEELISVSRDGDPLIRQLGAFTLGLFDEDEARDRLAVMLEDPDANTQRNAAVALARQSDARGLPVLQQVLREAAAEQTAGTPAEYEHYLTLKNSLEGIKRIAPSLKPEQRSQCVELTRPLAENYREPALRIAAKAVLLTLEEKPAPAAAEEL